MLIDEDDNYISSACTDDPKPQPVDSKCLLSRIVAKRSVRVWYHNSTARKCLPYEMTDCPVLGTDQGD